MIKKFFRRLLLLVVFSLAGSFSTAAAPLVIKVGTIAPEGSIWHNAILELRQQWQQLSGGQIELRIYPGGVLGDETEMVRKVQRRGLDGIVISGSGLPRIDSGVGCLNIPLLFDSYDELEYVRARVSSELERRIERRGFKVLAWAEAGWVYFFTKSPIHTPDELRRLRLWITPGFPEHERIFKELGFQVVPLPATDMLTSLQTGLIEAIDVPPLFALLDRSYQIAGFMTDLKWAPLNAAVVLSNQTWKKIPEHLRPKLAQVTQHIGQQLRQNVRKNENDALAEMQQRGLQVVKLNDMERKQWSSEVKGVYPRLPCSQDHPELFADILRLHKEHRSATAQPAKQ